VAEQEVPPVGDDAEPAFVLAPGVPYITVAGVGVVELGRVTPD